MSNSYKYKKLIDKCKQLSKLEGLEIFKIIQENNIKYTENNNGIHIVLNDISNDIIDKMINIIDYMKLQNIELLTYEEYLNSIKEKSTISNNNEYNDNYYLNNYHNATKE